MSEENKINIIVADDHEILANGLANILSNYDTFNVIGTASNGNEVLDLIRKNDIDVVVLDINMPELNGIEATEKIKKFHEEVKVIVLSMFDREGYIQNALDAGVDGYILKNANENEIASAIKRVMQGKTYFSQDVMEKLAIKMSTYRDTDGGIKLSEAERKILQFLGEGDTSDEIAVKMDVSTHSIVSYRKMLLQKFGAKNVSHLIKMAYEKGYLG